MRSWQRHQLGCLLWNDKRPVLFLNNHRRVDTLTSIPSIDEQPSITRPSVAVDYNMNKGHVDQVDQLRSYYVVERRGRRSWPALAWWLLDMCISNAYKLWCLDTNTEPGLLHFREQLLVQIVARFPSQHTHVQPSVPREGRRPNLSHWPKHSHSTRKCVQCTRGRRGGRKSEVVCELCEVHLCIDPCFKLYHEGHD